MLSAVAIRLGTNNFMSYNSVHFQVSQSIFSENTNNWQVVLIEKAKQVFGKTDIKITDTYCIGNISFHKIVEMTQGEFDP